MSSNKEELTRMGYKHGVYDQNHGNPMCEDQEYGPLYLRAYKIGYHTAARKSWYIVSLDDKNSTKHWFLDKGELGNEWVKTQTEATEFPTEQAVRERYISFTNNIGRGKYNYVWVDKINGNPHGLSAL